MSPAVWVAWAATVFCIIGTVVIALVFAQENARLFASLVFFALHWAFLLPYWGLRGQGFDLPQNLIDMVELLPVFSGFLLMLSAGPLRREAEIRNSPGFIDPGISKFDRWVLQGLLLTMVSHAPFVPGFLSERMHFAFIVLLGAAFTIVGFWLILEGLGRMMQVSETMTKGSANQEAKEPWLQRVLKWPRKKLTKLMTWTKTRGRPVQVLIWITVPYSIVELFFTTLLLMHRERQWIWIKIFEYVYAGLKLAFSSVFLYAICQDVRSRRPKIVVGTAKP